MHSAPTLLRAALVAALFAPLASPLAAAPPARAAQGDGAEGATGAEPGAPDDAPERAEEQEAGGAGGPATGTPGQTVVDPDALERAALEVEAVLARALLEGPRALDWELAAERLPADVTARFSRPGDGELASEAGIAIERFGPAPELELDRAGLLAALRAQLAGWTRVEHARLAVTDLVAGEGRALARARLELAGRTAEGGRAQLTATLGLTLAAVPDAPLRLRRVELLGGHRASAPTARFVDVSGAVGVGLELSYANEALLQELTDERMLGLVGGLSVIDWNRDGFPDLLATRRRQLSALFVNDGRGGFARAPLPLVEPRESPHMLLYLDLDGDGQEELVGSEVLGYEDARAWLSLQTRRQGEWTRLERALSFELRRGQRDLQYVALVPADVDGDGLVDLYAVGHRDGGSAGAEATPFAAFDGARDLLFMNQGGLAFREEAHERGLDGRQYGTSALFHDVDLDGDPDLVQGNAHGPDAFFENVSGRFERRPNHPLAASPDATHGMVLGDVAGDGSLALYRSGPTSPVAGRIRALAARADEGLGIVLAGIGAGGRLWRPGDEEGGLDAARTLGLHDAGWAFAPALLDLDGDGDQELFVASGRSSHRDAARPDWETLHWRQVVADAVNVVRGAPRAPVELELLLGFAGSFAGRQPDRVFLAAGPAGRRFEVGGALGLGALEDGRAAVALDFDGDGDLDLATHSTRALRLYENTGPPSAFVRVALEATQGDRNALGARVTLRAGGREQVAVVQATAGLQTQVPLALHFGLGEAASVEAITVRWPSGEEQSFGGLPAGVLLTLRQGAGEARVAEIPYWADALRPRPLERVRVEQRAERLEGGEALLGTTGRPAVVCFHRPGVAEDLATLRLLSAAALESNGAARFAAVCVDPSAAEAAREERAREQLAGEAFVASEALLAAFFGGESDVVTPATYVFGVDGRPRRVFRRPLAPGELAAALAVLGEEPAFALDLVRRAHWLATTGSFQEAIDALRSATRAEPRLAVAYLEIGRLFAYVKDFDKAEENFERAVTIDAELPAAWYNLGTARMYQERFAEAAAAFEVALELRPRDLETQLALGTARAEGGELEAALEAFRLACTTHPDAPTPWYLCGKAAADRGLTAEARAALARALELDPELQLAREALDALAD